MGFVPHVRAGFFPLDEELQLLPGSLTPALQEALVRLGAWMPFEKAAGLVADFMRLSSVSEGMARRHTEEAGAAYVAIQEQAVEQLEKTLPPAPAVPAKLVMEVDGAMVPLVGGEWAEVKTLVIGDVGQPVEVEGEPQVTLEKVSSFSRLSDCDSFARLSLVETHRRGVESARQVGVVADGAEWIGGFVDFHRPDAVRILDFAHAASYVSAIGQRVLGEGTPQTQEWLRSQLHCLKHEGAGVVLANLRAFTHSHAEVPDLKEALTYLEKREAQMCYPSFRSEGWPIGSGQVESANKLVVEARLKGAGMHWARGHVDPMLALRNVVCSERWAEAWPQIATYLRQQVTQRCDMRRQQRQRARLARLETMPAQGVGPGREPNISEPVQGDKGPTKKAASSASRTPQRPAPNHPWRHSPIGRARYRLTYSSNPIPKL